MPDLVSQLDNSDLIWVVKDNYGAFVYWNAVLAKSFPLPAGGMSGKTEYHFMPDDEAAAIRHNDQQVLRSGKTLSAVELVTLPDGEKTTWLVNKFRLTIKGDFFLAVVATSFQSDQKDYDSRLKSAQDLLQQERDLYQSALEFIVLKRLDEANPQKLSREA